MEIIHRGCEVVHPEAVENKSRCRDVDLVLHYIEDILLLKMINLNIGLSFCNKNPCFFSTVNKIVSGRSCTEEKIVRISHHGSAYACLCFEVFFPEEDRKWC